MTPRAQKSLRIIGLTIASILISALALAQTTNHPASPCKALSTEPKPPATHKPVPCRAGLHAETSISLGAFSQLTTTRSKDIPYQTTIVQGTAPSAGVLGTFRQTFSPWLGYSVNLGYTRLSEHYRGYGVGTDSGAYVDGFNVSTNVYESSVTYVAHTRVNKRYSIFADAGPGLLTFLPVHRGADAINYVPFQYASLVPGVQVRPTGLFGSGLDLYLTHRLSLRAEYRGLFYKNPDFQTGDAPYSKLMTLTSEPTLSVVYNFTHPR
jgi:opacity protein-like surface antigen